MRTAIIILDAALDTFFVMPPESASSHIRFGVGRRWPVEPSAMDHNPAGEWRQFQPSNVIRWPGHGFGAAS
jgi:hypothetical protein